MIKIPALVVTGALLIASTAATVADDKPRLSGAEKAARGLEGKAKQAKERGNYEAAKYYNRMAQLKRAGETAKKNGKKFNWSEYHKLDTLARKSWGKFRAEEEEKRKRGIARKEPSNNDPKRLDVAKKDFDKKDAAKLDLDKKKPDARAEERGADFLRAASHFTKKAETALQQGNENDASIYKELANINREAASFVSQGKKYNWSRFHILKERLTGE